MFLYWDGFEIDGSDTDFNVISPENVQVCEFVQCFLSMPLFSDLPKPAIFYYRKQEKVDLSLTKLKELLLTGDYPEIIIDINCRHPEQLPDQLKTSIFALSASREPREAAYGMVENPCTAPIIQLHYTRGEMTVELRIDPPGSIKEAATDEAEFDGYVYNLAMLHAPGRNANGFEINVGPTFYYEYAMFMMNYLRDHFPGLGFYGGLDCEGGWTDGCTYADSLYLYEKISVPVRHSIKNTLKRLTEYQIIRSYRSFYQSGWQYKLTDGFYIAYCPPVEQPKEKEPISFSEYVSLVETALSLPEDQFTQICDTAVHIKLPAPDEYAENKAAAQRLQQALPPPDQSDNEWFFTGYLAFAMADGKPVSEFRVHYTMKKYLLILLDLAESGMIDFIKAVTYAQRHD